MSQVRAAVRPRRLGRYNLIERLGIGGQGEVWRAHDGMGGVGVALKVLAPVLARSPSAWAALEREHAISTRLQHSAILQVRPPERLDGYVVLPMELADGGNLSQLRGKGYLEIVPVLLEIAGALEHAHARGVVHRDLKPGNVLFDSRGRVKIADFGIAALLPAAGTGQADARAGGVSPFTSSPGQLRGDPPSPADDIYGFGALVYELLAGHPPHYPNFDAARVQAGPVPQLVPIRPAPPQLIELVMRMLAKDADERPASMHEVIDELEATLNSTLTLEPTDLSDLLAGSVNSPGPDSASIPRPSSPSVVGQPSSSSPAASPPRFPEAAPPAPRAAAPPAPAARAVPITAAPEFLSVGDPLGPRIEAVPQLLGMRSPGARGALAAAGGSRRRPRRLGYLLSGLVGGAVIAVGALHWLSGQDLRGSPLEILSEVASRAREGDLPRAAVPPAVPGGGAASPDIVSGRSPLERGSPAAPSADAASLSRLAAQRADFNRRLSALAARGAAIWDASDFAAARAQAAESSGAEEAGGIAVAREHWQQATRALSAMESRAPQALAAELKSGQAALAARRQKSAAQAFALALRIDPGSRQALEGARQARRLSGVRPLQMEARHAERAHGYWRAARYERAVGAGLRAFGNGQLYQAQADFQQALVFRPQGIEAAKGLDEVNAALRERAARP